MEKEATQFYAMTASKVLGGRWAVLSTGRNGSTGGEAVGLKQRPLRMIAHIR